jgi:hypothetical protein
MKEIRKRKTVTRHSDPRDVAGPGTWKKTAKKKRHRNHKLKQIIGRPSLYKIPASAGLWAGDPTELFSRKNSCGNEALGEKTWFVWM